MAEASRTSKVLALSIGQTLTAIAGLVSGMVAARLLTKMDYATMKQTMLAYNFAAPLLMLGLPNALYYFLPREKNRKRGVLIDNITLLIIMGLNFSAFLLFGGTDLLATRFNNPNLTTTLKWLIPYPLYVMPAAVLGAVLLTQDKTLVLAKYNVISSLLMVGLTIAAVVFTRSYTGPLLVQIYFPLLLLPVILWLSFKYVPGKITMPDKDSMKEMLKYAAPLGIAGMMGTLMLQTNQMVVSAMCTPVEFANYVNGAIEIPLIGVITGSIASVILVDMTNYIHEGNYSIALDLFKKAAIKSAAILFPVMFFLLVAGKSFIVTIYSAKYLESVIPFYIYLFILPIRIVVYGSALMALGQSKVILIRSVFDLVINTVLSIVFVYFFGYLGAAIATIATLYIWTVPYNLYKIGQGFNVSAIQTLPFKQLGKLILICAIPIPLVMFTLLLPQGAHLWRLLLAAILYFPAEGILLLKYKYIEIPEKLYQFIPVFITNKLKQL